jgi:hypothetical protein
MDGKNLVRKHILKIYRSRDLTNGMMKNGMQTTPE